MIAPLHVLTRNILGHVSATVNVCLQRPGIQARQNIRFHPVIYQNSPCTMHSRTNTRQPIAKQCFGLPIYVRIELIRYITDLRQKVVKSLKLEQRLHKKDYERRAHFALGFCVSDFSYLNRSSFFCLAVKEPALKGNTTLSPGKQRTYQGTGANKNTLQIVLDRLENAICIHRATLNQSSGPYCDDEPDDKQGGSSKEELSSERWPEANGERSDSNYAVIVSRNLTAHRCRLTPLIICAMTRYSSADVTTEPPQRIPQQFIKTFWSRCDVRRRKVTQLEFF